MTKVRKADTHTHTHRALANQRITSNRFRSLSTGRLGSSVDLYKWPCAPSTHHLYVTHTISHFQSRPAKLMGRMSSRIAHAPVTSTELFCSFEKTKT